jgi:hypothetical protein
MDAAAAWVVERIPKDRDLTLAELTELAATLGRERRLWQAKVRHDPGERVFVELYRDIHVDVWLICWDNDQDTGYHDHDLSSGAVYTCVGVLNENRLVNGAGRINEVSVPHAAGSVFDFDAARVHCMAHGGGEPAVSVHCYSPALWRMGYYSFDEGGNLCRTSVTYADEMWAQPSGLEAMRR